MNVMQSTIERLRPLVGMKGWDYCVLWKLRDDQRCIEWMGCCCGGSETTEKGEEHLFPVSPRLPCRDMMFQHLRTNSCDFLAELPSSMPLDSGIHTQALISSQPKWINISNISDSSISDETVRTRVLIPVAEGLVELFVEKHVHEDQHIIEFVMAQFNHSWDQEAMIVRNITDTNFHDQLLDREINGPHLTDGYPAENPIGHQAKPFSAIGYDPKNTDHFQPWIPPATDNLNLTWDLSADQIRLCNSPTNIFGGQPFPPSDSRHKNAIFFEGSTDSILSDKPPSFNAGTDHGFPEIVALQQSLRTTASNLHPSIPESSVSKELGHEKDSIKQEMGRGASISDCSDQVEDDDDHKTVGRSGRRHQSKNLVAERKRRKKLNDRLYALRALVPKITKMDRAAILGDAIDFVKELLKQVKDLQDELEETLDEGRNQNGNKDNLQLEILNQNPISHGDGESSHGLRMEMADHGNRCSSSNKTGDPMKQNHDSLSIDDKTQQMEVQVEVSQLEGNEFFLKVFCEHKPGGFVRLMEAMNSLGLEVTNANVTTFRGLVLNVFKVEKRDNEVVQADQVRDSLLELTRDPNGGWSEPGNVSENGATDHHHQHQHHQHHHHPMNSHLHHLDHQP